MFTAQDLPRLVGLVYFTTVYHTGSKRKTAESLGTSVDKINKYLEYLQTDDGNPLFISNGHGCIVAPGAQKLLESGLAVEAAVHQLDKYVRKKNAFCSEVSICLSEGCSLELLPSNFAADFSNPPTTKLKIFFHDEMSVVCPQNSDIILSTSPIRHKGLSQISSREIPCRFYASPDYIKANGMPQSLEDLLHNHRIINRSNDHVWGWNEIAPQALKIICETNSHSGLLSLMHNGDGIGILPEIYNSGNLVAIDTLNPDLRITVYLQANLSSKDISEIRPIITAIRDHLNEI